MRKYKKKEKKAVRDDLDDEQKEHLKIGQRYRKRKQKYRAAKTQTNVHKLQMKEIVFLILFKCVAWLIHPYLSAFRLIEEDFKTAIQEGLRIL